MADDTSLDWRMRHRDLQAETDPEKLREKAMQLEAAIFERCQQLDGHAGDDSERESLKKAIAQLRKVQVEKLGFPVSDLESSASRSGADLEASGPCSPAKW